PRTRSLNRMNLQAATVQRRLRHLDQAVHRGLRGSIARLDEFPQSPQTVKQREERGAAAIVKLAGDPPPLVLAGAQQTVEQAPLGLVAGERFAEPISRLVDEWRNEDDR